MGLQEFLIQIQSSFSWVLVLPYVIFPPDHSSFYQTSKIYGKRKLILSQSFLLYHTSIEEAAVAWLWASYDPDDLVAGVFVGMKRRSQAERTKPAKKTKVEASSSSDSDPPEPKKQIPKTVTKKA